MLASLGTPPLAARGHAYEPKHDGIRALVSIVRPTHLAHPVRIYSRLGNDKTAQFPELAREFARLGAHARLPLLIDGEIVAIERGKPAGFQRLQGRMHLTGEHDIRRATAAQEVSFVAFDLLREGDRDLRPLPFDDRRARLVARMASFASPLIGIIQSVNDDGRALHQQALDEGWEGLIVKDRAAPYVSGRRSPAWVKLKVVQQQEFVIGGWTEPRQTRQHLGALLLGLVENSRLRYVGHTGTGFTEAELARLAAILRPLETPRCPFTPMPRTNERPHWVRPELVAQVRFSEWTADRRVRHPVYLGLRDDVTVDSNVLPADLNVLPAFRRARLKPGSTSQREANLLEGLADLEARGADGVLELADGQTLEVTNLGKIFWPGPKLTKGDLLRYYVRVAPFILPAVAERPLVMRRFPNGVAGKAFYQHRAPVPAPPGVRIERMADRPHLIGGSLVTLLYMSQLAAISQDPWFSRAQTPEFADCAALDLDPSEGVGFAKVLDVARWIRDELAALGAPAVPKTSGASGLHIYVPLPPKTPFEAGMLFCQIVATVVATKHSRTATITRAVGARGRTVYVDYLQNIQGKTLAAAYSARASDFAGVSTPLEWKEIDEGVDPRDFTIRSAPERFARVGDLWGALRSGPTVDLQAVERYTKTS